MQFTENTTYSPQWMRPGKRIILASSSPRRAELMSGMGLSFETASPVVENEHLFIDTQDIEGSLQRLALEKARAISIDNPDALVLGADTIVWRDGVILGKPRDAAEARAMLARLSGKRHTVFSAVGLMCADEHFSQSAVAKTEVSFRTIHDQEIDWYISSGEYSDKAGGYGIQGKAKVFVEFIEGCYYNVVGLPIVKTISLFNAYVTRKE